MLYIDTTFDTERILTINLYDLQKKKKINMLEM